MIMADDIMGEGSGPPSALGTLDRVGAKVSGFIIGDPEKKPDLDDTTKEQKTFKSGDLRWIWLVPIQTELNEWEDDDGKRTLWLSWKSLNAFTAAVKEGWKLAGRVGSPRPEVGGYIEMEITKLTSTGFGGTKTKDWKATYIAPASAPQASEMMSEQPTSPAPQSPAPAAQAPARSTMAQVAQDQGNLLQRMQAEAAARRASGNLPPPPHHGQDGPPF